MWAGSNPVVDLRPYSVHLHREASHRQIDAATEWARKAFSTDRRSIISLATVADELYHETRARFGDEPAISALNDVIASFYALVSDR